jgi:hypothetical protein
VQPRLLRQRALVAAQKAQADVLLHRLLRTTGVGPKKSSPSGTCDSLHMEIILQQKLHVMCSRSAFVLPQVCSAPTHHMEFLGRGRGDRRADAGQATGEAEWCPEASSRVPPSLSLLVFF